MGRTGAVDSKKRAAVDWTVGRLLTIILAIVLIVLIIYGFSSGAINPLKERIIGMWDNVLAMFGFGGGGDNDDCYDYGNVVIEEGIEGNLELCSKYCQLELKKGIDIIFEGGVPRNNVESFKLKNGVLQYWNNRLKSWMDIVTVFAENPDLVRKKREAYLSLKEGIPVENDFKVFRDVNGVPKTGFRFKIEAKGLFGKTFYVDWSDVGWMRWTEGDLKESVDWSDEEALNYVWKESTKGIDDVVYWGEYVFPASPSKWNEIGKISSDEKFDEVRKLFIQKKEEFEKRDIPTQQELENFKSELLKQEIVFNEQSQELGVELQEIGEYQYVVLYFSPENRQYGLVLDSSRILEKNIDLGINTLVLVEYDETEKKWNVVTSHFFLNSDEDLLESYVKLSKIKNSLEEKCR